MTRNEVDQSRPRATSHTSDHSDGARGNVSAGINPWIGTGDRGTIVKKTIIATVKQSFSVGDKVEVKAGRTKWIVKSAELDKDGNTYLYVLKDASGVERKGKVKQTEIKKDR